jgi:FMN reductase
MIERERTMSERTIVVVTAGLSQPSSTRLLADRLAEATVSELAQRGVTAAVEVIELRDIAHEITNMMLTGFATGALSDALDKLTRADGVIAVTPLFTTTYSGLFKSFVDVIGKDALTGMPVLLGATGGTPRHSLALEYSVRPLFTYLRADVASTSVFAATDDWAGPVDSVNPLPARIRRAGRELADMVAARENVGPADLYDDAPTFDQMLAGM